jgi:murein DD-endopeptidase MepM/ murein hydrolase activator NlpD
MPLRLIAFCLSILLASPAAALSIYKYTDRNGVVTYTDQETAGAQVFVFRERTPEGANLRPQPLAYRYALPWRGGPFRLSQGANGKYSHFTREGRYALDIAMPEGTPIVAARAGIVVKIENSQSGRGPNPSGNYVRLLHDDGTMGVYLHLLQGSVLVGEGQRLEQGRLLARSGNTGNSTGPHLHFVVQRAVGLAMESIPFDFNQPLDSLPNFAVGGE